MAARTRYTVPNMDEARELARMASEAIEAAREGTPNQRELADELFRAIYGAAHLTPAELLALQPGGVIAPKGAG